MLVLQYLKLNRRSISKHADPGWVVISWQFLSSAMVWHVMWLVMEHCDCDCDCGVEYEYDDTDADEDEDCLIEDCLA